MEFLLFSSFDISWWQLTCTILVHLHHLLFARFSLGKLRLLHFLFNPWSEVSDPPIHPIAFTTAISPTNISYENVLASRLVRERSSRVTLAGVLTSGAHRSVLIKGAQHMRIHTDVCHAEDTLH